MTTREREHEDDEGEDVKRARTSEEAQNGGGDGADAADDVGRSVERVAAEAEVASTKDARVTTPMPTPVPATTATVLAGASGGTAMVQGVVATWDDAQFKAWLDARGVSRVSSKKRPRWTYGFVTFGRVEDRIHAMETLSKVEIKGRLVRVKQANPRGKSTASDANLDADGLIAAANASALRDIRDVITPLWKVPYGEQLARKKDIVAESLRSVTRAIRNGMSKARKRGMHVEVDWLRPALANDKLCCDIEGIVRSPVLDGYRNKSEFTIGPGANGEPTCGFNVGLFREGVTAVSAPKGCRNISDTAKYLGNAIEVYLRARAAEGKGLPVYDKRTASGFWRLFTCREGGMAPNSEHGWKHWLRPGTGPPKPAVDADGKPIVEENPEPFEYPNEEDSLPAPSTKDANSEVMVVLQVCKRDFTDEQIAEERRGMHAAIKEAAAKASPPINLKVCLLQYHDGRSNAAPDDAEIVNLETSAPSEKATDVIHEQMCGLQFSLSATAFFQVNTIAAEALYRLAGEWASPNGKSLLLDVCCGTGTIGLTLARNVGKVVGVDIVEESIKDAFVNAKLNGVDNTDWRAGKAEQVLPKVLNEYKSLIKPAPNAPTPKRANKPRYDPDLSGDEAEEAIIPEVAPTQECETSNENIQDSYLYDDVVAIVDPPRAGLHKHVLSALRRESRLKRLVYVSCNSKTMAENTIELCMPQGADGNGGGAPFKPVKALALDLFPHTEHVEAILLLER